MTPEDDWRGAHLIKGRIPTREQRQSYGMSAVSSLAAERARRLGKKPLCKDEHDRFVSRVFREIHHPLPLD